MQAENKRLQISQRKKKRAMKNTLIRLLIAMTLTSSLPAFALSGKDKNRTKDCSCASDPSSTDKNAQGAKPSQDQTNNDPAQARKQLIEEEDAQWLHDLQGIYGG
jgi:hypothetical protein